MGGLIAAQIVSNYVLNNFWNVQSQYTFDEMFCVSDKAVISRKCLNVSSRPVINNHRPALLIHHL